MSRKSTTSKGEGLSTEVGAVAKDHKEVNFSKCHCLLTVHDAVDGFFDRSDVRARDLHGIQGLPVEYVEIFVAIHEHLLWVLVSDVGVDRERRPS